MRKLTSSRPKTCPHCQTTFYDYWKSGYKTCSEECQRGKDLVASLITYPDGSDHVECQICGLRGRQLNNHVKHVHKMTSEEYKTKFNITSITCDGFKQEQSSRILGEKNPAAGHGGKFSPFSSKFVGYAGFTENEITDQIDSVITQANASKVTNNSVTTTVEYWMGKGLSREDAEDALRKRQTTFSLEICIEKYGEEDGRKRWEERQIKWQDIMTSKPQEEIDRINRLKIGKASVSGAETELAETLRKCGYDIETQHIIYKSDVSWYAYDIKHENKIIEYHGDYWHCNPIKYEPDYHHTTIGKTAEDIWARDADKVSYAEQNGFEVLCVWETDYNNNKEEVIEQCLNFLTK